MYKELFERIMDAMEFALKHELEMNTVVINGKKYGKLFNEWFFGGQLYHTPSIFGLAMEVANLPDDYDFIVQYRHEPPISNYDKILAENKELKEKLNKLKEILGEDI